ncbi:MAG: helix-turn-helix domain-containing protein, partial [Lachnospiraceae bacterium]|nr:helix-turn-helix domain-containing protein [Lachnospiraceae bacterium]
MLPVLEHGRETVQYQEIQGVRFYHNDLTEDYPLHWHTATEIIAPTENDYTIEAGSEKYVLQTGDIAVIMSGTLHKLSAPETGKRYILLFDYNLIGNVTSLNSLLHSLGECIIIRKDENRELAEKLIDYIQQIQTEYEAGKPYAGAAIYSLLIRFMVDVGRSCMEERVPLLGKTSAKNKEYVGRFMDVCNYISEHCTEDIDMDALAEMAGFSRFHFARLFKEFAHVSCYEYLTQKRILLSEMYLNQPDLSILDVALLSGFKSLSTFNRVFKSYKSCTPSEYRKMNRRYVNKPALGDSVPDAKK